MRKRILQPIEKEPIQIPVNNFTVISTLVFIVSFGLFANWFFGAYKLRSPVVVKIQVPFEARINGVPKVSARERSLKKVTPTQKPKEQSLLPTPTVVEAAASATRTEVPIEEGIAYIKKKFAPLGDSEVKIAIAISKSENFVNAHPSYFKCDQYGAVNKNGTIDLGAMQINSPNWPKYGGEEALKDCFNNWDAGYEMRTSWNNWHAWSAYNNGSYLNFLEK